MPSAAAILRHTTAALALLAALASCGSNDASFSYEAPPAGVPDTPYWYQIADSLFWYRAVDSQAVVQMTPGSTPESKSAALVAVRRLGWRMAVLRTAGLSRSAEPQELSQSLFAVERVGEAAPMIGSYGKFREALWSGADTSFMGLLPGLVAKGQGVPRYYWPCALTVVWKPGLREADVRSLIDSLGFTVFTPPTLTQSYWVERAWSVYLSPGAELFTWLRWFNRDARVHLAHPVFADREPPVPDHRILRHFLPGPDSLVPAAVGKFSPLLRTAWEVATFCGHTRLVTQATSVQSDDGRLLVRFKLDQVVSDLAARVKDVGGEITASQPEAVEAWVPYGSLPDCAALSAVGAVEEVRANLLDGK